jgi:hypothetical protein
MDRGKGDHYFGVPPLFVRKLTKANVERAIAALLEDPQWLEVYGAFQVRE